MKTIEPVVMAFAFTENSNEKKDYFIGSSKEAILKQTKEGKGFGEKTYSSYEIIKLDDVKDFKFINILTKTILEESVKKGIGESYWIGSR